MGEARKKLWKIGNTGYLGRGNQEIERGKKGQHYDKIRSNGIGEALLSQNCCNEAY